MIARWTERHTAEMLRAPGPHDDKYRRGVLGMRTGAAHYPGAAVLGVSAAWRTGVGMVRYVPPDDESAPPYGLPTAAAAVLEARPETVIGPPVGRPCDAWVIGSGTDATSRSVAELAQLRGLLAGDAAVVVDAGALDLVVDDSVRAAPLILTPHGGEFERLWRSVRLGGLPEGWDPRGIEPGPRARAAAQLASAVRATVLLKGSVTICASPDGWVRRSGPATPWLASAGTGDVLAGLLGALVAGRSADARSDPGLLARLAATAAVLHDRAARHASGDESADGSGRPVTALEIAAAIPHVLGELLARQA
ncbi:ADP/ATP-dependent (S)-NAD(P)H-hydrate dehydratase [Leucobacter sp. L43]|uniref:ADP-dependent NAD(P)H-hydrate dehydratase n=1 Tax=Leucobacter sp. L43 TaxID=2798040 RepID=UPI0019066CCA|nr:ADP/ATP-dependent (S)-NAD(P)H-hydrate dehydratase [Leucobacter sp. L43]